MWILTRPRKFLVIVIVKNGASIMQLVFAGKPDDTSPLPLFASSFEVHEQKALNKLVGYYNTMTMLHGFHGYRLGKEICS